ncbi:cellulase family glycosylhydrolase [Kutzneria viridogrisea]|uniref:Glycoside hydrolase family 5 domain-containing protein n=2 Tax=Kutzneria TaxID=43356 RepID=W5WJS0_9PSEU|nr:cellulase family glycosylhydrolase [Kutzneria albida]AHH98414.1 hypothetical protein KALB_5052 [Kutzneria albida DSM 43870]MBA8924066.1 hypothetical protein [Kutzneria viridogrisea]
MRAVAAVLVASLAVVPAPADPPPPTSAITVRGNTFVDGAGREVVLRGFNVSGGVKLGEHGGLPFAEAEQARQAATEMRRLTGANAVRFLLNWAAAEPVRGQSDPDYHARLTEQLRAFLDQGFAVITDWHQDLVSRALFARDSWYTGDGAPAWALAPHPHESCGICVHWGQNITQNSVVQQANADFWHNRDGVREEFLAQAGRTMEYLRTHLSAAEFAGIVGMDPWNEPYAGRYDQGQDSRSWERDLLWPFYQRFRARMDAAGWQDKPAFVEPNLFWNSTIGLVRQTGGLLDAGVPGPRYVFNSHFYDTRAQSGVLMPGKAGDGQYTADLNAVRGRAEALGTAAVLTEFGHPLTGFTSDKAPTVDKALYQALDSTAAGSHWWAHPVGAVLSGTQWHWDTASGRHHELMNDNPDKVITAADAWNGEDFSAVRTAEDGTVLLRQDQRLLDRLYPKAVAGHLLGFSYEDRSRDGEQALTFAPVPDSLPATKALVGEGRYGVLLWRGSTGSAPTALHLPAGFAPQVVSDVPWHQAGDELLLDSSPGTHWALVLDRSPAPDGAARAELVRWVASVLSGKSQCGVQEPRRVQDSALGSPHGP